ncbi:GntR family transcriptional regulator [Gelidibacter salicanalis]|uniref:GntR family transcriptional regulator n=1 Tax=Gelidibacter salicanalis TaxID=291193 RepID=A0A934KP57_9FLAO|nr:GntR family transcriptional regulator [Gelidibacter salicanalis]MBJ7882921.1 GntR family transcriptional regulator [Gelidibacter salicanalis]
MKLLFEKINELKKISTLTKHEKLIKAIEGVIEAKDLKKGDKLPSINIMVAEVGFARKTIVKAYEDLKGRGIVESKNFKGYYIADVNTKTKLRVALVLYAFHTFQEDFYNTFRKELGKKYIINVFFHHNNLDVFKDILTRISGRYGMYVVAPIQTPEVSLLLKKIPSDKLLVIDRHVSLPSQYSYITQEFESSTYEQLKKLLIEINKYKQFVLFFNNDSDYPIGILNAFKKFTKEFNINAKVEAQYEPGSIKKDRLYFFINDSDLWEILKDSKTRNYVIGKDLGLLAHNDNAIKEIICGGITTISIDFKKMAKESANYLKLKEHVQKIIPSQLIQRKSL